MRKTLIVFSLLLFSLNAWAKDELPVRCTGDSVIYRKESNTICGEGNVEINYKGNYIRADKIQVNLKTKEVEAEGRIIFSDGVNVVTGDRLYYNLETGKVEVDGIGSTMAPWFVYGEQGERISEELYYIKNGFVTTCDYEKPHTRIKARDLYLYPGDKIVAKHIIFYWGNVPLFYWPYYKRSLKDKESRWTIIPGNDSKLGAFLLTGYSMYWENFLGGVFEPIFRLDYYEKRGLATGLYGRYRYKDKIQALIRSYIINDRAYEDWDGVTREKLRGRFSIDYIQRISSDTRLLIDLNYLSDPKIVYDFFRDEFEDEIQTKNYINVAKSFRLCQVNLMIKKRFHNFYNDLEKLPEVSVDFLEHRIGNSLLFYTADVNAGYLQKVFEKGSIEEDYSSARFDTRQTLRYPKKFFGWLNIIPRIGTRQTYYSKRAEEKEIVIETVDNKGKKKKKIKIIQLEEDKGTWRSVYYTGIEFSTKISRIFYLCNDFWQINQLRHLIEPRINYSYQHEPTVSEKHLLDFDDLETKHNYMALELRNKLQTKRDGLAWDLVDLWLGTRYYPHKYEISGEMRSFSNIRGIMEIEPFNWLAARLDANYDQYDRMVDTFNTELVLYRGDWFSFGLGYRYTHDSAKLWTSEINYTINSNWALRMQHRYDFDTGRLQQDEYILFRDLHCWNMAATLRQNRDTDETAYFIVFYPKAYPDIPITFGTTFFGRNDTAEVDFGGMEGSIDYGT